MWTQKTDDQIKAAVRDIIKSSSNDEEIKRRLHDELGYPYGDVAICSHLPTDSTDRVARTIVAGLGGLIRKDGAMVMLMMHGPRGNTISL